MTARHRDPRSSDLERENEQLRRELAEREQQIHHQAEQIAEQKQQITDAEKQIADLERQLGAAQTELYELFQTAVVRWTGRGTATARPAQEEPAEGRWTTWPSRAHRLLVPITQVDEIRPILPDQCQHCGYALPADRTSTD